MEIVTLGVVGDSWCGKSQLLLSYTSNFVRNVYIPTVLDCLWTTVNVDGDFIDLRVWDNTGSDDIEYKRLRPLSYPQTEVFLVCFSLKSRLTLVNVETRWIPEVRTHTEAPFLLVGCKRVKHCDPPTQTLEKGNSTAIIFPFTDGVYSFGMNVTFQCNTGYEFTDDTKTDVIYCNQDNKWTNLTKTCALISCPTFNVSNGNVTFTSFLYEGVATVTCAPTYWTENNMAIMSVQCQADKTWTLVPTCKVTNQKKRSQEFSSQTDVVREITDEYTQTDVRSGLDCAALCTADFYCLEANYKEGAESSTGVVCRMFTDQAEPADLTSETGWHYMKKDQG